MSARLEYRLAAGDGVNRLAPTDAAARALGADDVRVAVRAVSLNARDLAIVNGHYPVPHTRAIVPCSDGAGVVTEIGSGVTGLAVGDRVVGTFFRDWDQGAATAEAVGVSHGCEVDGWLASEVVQTTRSLVKIPDALSFVDAACAPCAGVTAWNALFTFGGLRQGDTALAHGSGGVAIWAAQLAAAAGARCVLTTRSANKLAALGRLEAVEAIDTQSRGEWLNDVPRLTDGRGIDVVVETGGHDTLAASIAAAGFGGRIGLIGGLSGWSYPELNALGLIVRQIGIKGIHVGSTQMLRDLLAFTAEHRIKPVVSASFRFADARAAFAALGEAQHVGKIVITDE